MLTEAVIFGMIATLPLVAGVWYLFYSKRKRYWSVGAALIFGGSGFFQGMQRASSVDSMFTQGVISALLLGVTFGLVGGIVDLWQHSRSKNKAAAPQAPKSSPSQTVAHSGNDAKQTASVDDPYAILGVSPEAEPEVITVAYEAMMRKHQLDTARAKKIIEAYAILKDPEQRSSYDSEAKQSAGKEDAPPPPPPLASAADPISGGALEEASAETPPLPPRDELAPKTEKTSPLPILIGIILVFLLLAVAIGSQEGGETSSSTESAPISEEMKAAMDTARDARVASQMARTFNPLAVSCPTNRDWDRCYDVHTWPSGDRYEGYWANNAMDGYGVYISASGVRYEGRWKEGRRNGYVATVYSSEHESFGYYEDGKLLRIIR